MFYIDENFDCNFEAVMRNWNAKRRPMRKRLLLSDTIEDAEYEVITQQ